MCFKQLASSPNFLSQNLQLCGFSPGEGAAQISFVPIGSTLCDVTCMYVHMTLVGLFLAKSFVTH